jgi:sugar lactone lactonase YvrE
MKRVIMGVGTGLLALAAYLLLWPVPIAPVAWEAPEDRGYLGPFEPNADLADLTQIDMGTYHGPEDVVALPDGRIATATQGGVVLAFDPEGETFTVIAETGGVPLGMEMGPEGRLIVADAYRGLLVVSLDGQVEALTNVVDGSPILYADDLDIGPDGVIYFSDASTKFGAEAGGSTLASSLLELMESAGTGRVLAFDPADGSTRLVSDGWVFSNGVAIAPDGDLLVLETGRYRLYKVDPDTGARAVLIDNLPGFPDNINRGPTLDDGTQTYFVGIVSPRSQWLDDNADKPLARRIAMRLPAFMRPQAENYGLILHIDGDGNILRSFHDPDGAYPTTTGAVVVGDRMYITSLTSPTLGYRPYP